MSFRYLHAADLHLDTPFQGLGVTDPQLQARLRDASLVALDALVDAALREEVSFVVIAGDVYDGVQRGLRAQIRLLNATTTLARHGVRTFVAFGNHDPVGPSKGWVAVREWPEEVMFFPSDRVASASFTARDGSPVTVSGISYPRRDVTEPLHLHFPRPTTPGFHVAVLHAHVGAASEHQPYSPCQLEDLVPLGYDAWALGHIHQRRILRSSAPFVAYSGNAQGRNLRETGPRGAWIVEVRGGEIEPRFVELGPVRFEVVNLDGATFDDLGELVEAWQSEGARLADGRPIVARASVTGRSSLFGELTRHDPAELLRILRDGAPAEVRWADVVSDLRPLLRLDSLLDRQDLHGELARTRSALTVEELRTMVDHDGLVGVNWTDDELLQLRDEAADLAATLLETET